jgi:hypothetical protein
VPSLADLGLQRAPPLGAARRAGLRVLRVIGIVARGSRILLAAQRELLNTVGSQLDGLQQASPLAALCVLGLRGLGGARRGGQHQCDRRLQRAWEEAENVRSEELDSSTAKERKSSCAASRMCARLKKPVAGRGRH